MDSLSKAQYKLVNVSMTVIYFMLQMKTYIRVYDRTSLSNYFSGWTATQTATNRNYVGGFGWFFLTNGLVAVWDFRKPQVAVWFGYYPPTEPIRTAYRPSKNVILFNFTMDKEIVYLSLHKLQVSITFSALLIII